jgi:putative YhdH/YhfP family quinone oxidoreductase
MIPDRFRACLVEAATPGRFGGRMTDVASADLPPGEVVVRVEYSSLNYKDAMASGGNPGIVRRLPHVPGIDAAGIVVQSAASEAAVGARVLVTGYELGAERWGGWAEYIRTPAEWVVPLPEEVSCREAMILGTAGFTAAQSVEALERNGITPDRGDVVVTGATGGVGCVAVLLLATLGYRVCAVTGKRDQHDWLRDLGAAELLPREAVNDASAQPLLKSRWAGAVDTVGGNTLATIVRSLEHRGCVAACGLVGGTEIPLTVYPFLLRGAKLDGIDSAKCPTAPRREIWRKLWSDWKLAGLERVASESPLAQVGEVVERMLGGRAVGRTVVRIG